MNAFFRHLCLAVLPLLPMGTAAQGSVHSATVMSLQTVVNANWLGQPVMRLGSADVLNVSFDELSHNYHRYICLLEHCEADWTESSDLFESDWLEGFNRFTIDDYEPSVNTTVAYTHYTLRIPNDYCRLTMSGNYRLHIIDEDNDDEEVLTTEFMVTEQSMTLSLAVTTNTDIDANRSHQQLSMGLAFGDLPVTDPSSQLYTVVMQNGRSASRRTNVAPTLTSLRALEWAHCRPFIFSGGNEYRKFEILDVTHPTLGLESVRWDGAYFQAYPFVSEPRLNYLYDQDADGAFYIRNSDNRDNDTASDYVWVNYRLQAPPLTEGKVVIDGRWTTGNPFNYVMDYDADQHLYTARILQKQGYYSYQYLWQHDDGSLSLLPSEGDFYQTGNRYQALVYYRYPGDRTWRLTAYREIQFN